MRRALLGHSCLRASTRTIHQSWTSPVESYPWRLVDDRPCQTRRRVLDPESVGPAAPTFARAAAFVLPVRFSKEWDVNPPDNHRTTCLHAFGWVDGITPDNVPPSMVVVGLYRRRGDYIGERNLSRDTP